MKTGDQALKKFPARTGKNLLSVVMFKIDLLNSFGNNGLIQQWCGFHNNIVWRNSPCFEIVTTDIFHKMVNT